MKTIEGSVIVRAPIGTTYATWANPQIFPVFSPHVRSVERIDKNRTRWVADLLGYQVQFDAELDEARPNKFISWHSTTNVKHFGSAYFEPVTGGTAVAVRIMFDTGSLSSNLIEDLDIAWNEFKDIFEDALYGFKRYVEQMWLQVPFAT